MPVETANFISQLNPAYPLGSDDSGDGDNHLRLIKSILQAQFPEFTAAALNATQAEIEAAIASVTGLAKLLLLVGSVAAPGLAVVGDEDTGLYSPGANQLALAVGGLQALLISSDKSLALQGDLSIQGTLTSQGVATGPGFMPIGGSTMWFSDTLPTGFGSWAWMNGQSVSAATYAALAAVYPGLVSSGNVVLPDMREVVPVGKYNMGGSGATPGRVTNYALNTVGYIFGESAHALVVGELAIHNHGVTDPGHTHAMPNGYVLGSTSVGTQPGVNPVPYGITGLPSTLLAYTNISIQNAGSGTAHNNMQPGITCNWIMRIA